jgi:hypothetical protein
LNQQIDWDRIGRGGKRAIRSNDRLSEADGTTSVYPRIIVSDADPDRAPGQSRSKRGEGKLAGGRRRVPRGKFPQRR